MFLEGIFYLCCDLAQKHSNFAIEKLEMFQFYLLFLLG